MELGNVKKIAIIGGGNMGSAIARGICASCGVAPQVITITRRNADALKPYAAEGFATTTSNNDAVRNAEVVIFAVKPYQIAEVAANVLADVSPKALCISIATGVSVDALEKMLPNNAVVRVMPNTAAEVGQSVTAIVGGHTTSAEQLKLVQDIFSGLGLALVVDESLMPALTALTSCGIAHALRFIRAAMESGIEMGLTSKVSAQVVAQTVKGAAELILRNGSHPEVEIDKVCTPKGVTITGINEMEHAGFSSAVMKGIMGSYNKIVK